MRGVVVYNQMDLKIGRNVGIDMSEELEVFLMTMSGFGLGHHPTRGNIQRSEQGCGAVPLVVVSDTFHVARSQRQQRLTSFQRLDLALFVHAQDHSVFGRIQI